MCSSGAISTETIKQVEFLQKTNTVLCCCFGCWSLEEEQRSVSSYTLLKFKILQPFTFIWWKLTCWRHRINSQITLKKTNKLCHFHQVTRPKWTVRETNVPASPPSIFNAKKEKKKFWKLSILKICSLCVSNLTSCLCPVSCPCVWLHLFLMCFTCVQFPRPSLCTSLCASLCLCQLVVITSYLTSLPFPTSWFLTVFCFLVSYPCFPVFCFPSVFYVFFSLAFSTQLLVSSVFSVHGFCLSLALIKHKVYPQGGKLSLIS